MIGEKYKDRLNELYHKIYKQFPQNIEKLPISGSNRKYYRIFSNNKTIIGVCNSDIDENKAFLSFTKAFKSINLPVPEIYAVDSDEEIYLLEDLGDTTVFKYLKETNNLNLIHNLYKKIIDKLICFQFDGFNVIDFSLCYPRSSFDEQSIRWDLNYFKYNFLKFLNITFNEQLLENDFNALLKKLTGINSDTFLYRDFQSSNIMIYNDEVLFIDYQGGRKGAFYYDLVSLLYDAKANLENMLRNELKDYYYSILIQRIKIDKKEFDVNFSLFALIRIMQAMGAYGFRGLYEKKEQFIKSIPFAVSNLKQLVSNTDLFNKYSELIRIFNQLYVHPDCQFIKPEIGKLTVSICSFSYKKGIPVDKTGNGGGFVFDCRGLPNPGRYAEYKHVTGKDPEVIQFFKDKGEVNHFLENVMEIIGITVTDYIERNRTHLMVNFGCTGGQHRSVYCAEKLAQYLKKFNINIAVKHLEQDMVL